MWKIPGPQCLRTFFELINDPPKAAFRKNHLLPSYEMNYLCFSEKPFNTREEHGSRLSYESSVEITLFFSAVSWISIEDIDWSDLFQEWKNKSINSPRPRLWELLPGCSRRAQGWLGIRRSLSGWKWMDVFMCLPVLPHMMWSTELWPPEDCCLIQEPVNTWACVAKGLHCRLCQACSISWILT